MLKIEDDNFYTVGEVAELLGVTKKTVWARARSGAFPPFRGAKRTQHRGYWGKDIKKMFGYYIEE